jgi:hypothetical protein
LKKAEIQSGFTAGTITNMRTKMRPKQRRRNKETALESMLEDERELKKDRDMLTQDPPTPQQQKLPFDQGVERGPPILSQHRQSRRARD